MLTAPQYALLHGYKYETVNKWCREGKIQCVLKPKRENSKMYVYMLEKDAPAPPVRNGARPRMKFGQKEEMVVAKEPAGSAGKKRTQREISLFIRKHCKSMTYGRIAQALDMTTLEVRAVYDRLHARYGI